MDAFLAQNQSHPDLQEDREPSSGSAAARPLHSKRTHSPWLSSQRPLVLRLREVAQFLVVAGPGLRLRVPEVDSKYLSSDHSDEHHHQVLYACTASVWWSYLCSLVICHCRGWSTNLLVIGGFIVLLAISPCPPWVEGERLHLPRA